MDFETLPKFKASDGRDILLMPGWVENKKNIGWPQGIKDYKTFVEVCVLTEKTYPTNPNFCVNKLVTANAMKCMIEESGHTFDGQGRMLDIATGPAVLPRVLKGLGLCREAHGVDVEDRSNAYSDDLMMEIWRQSEQSTYLEEFEFGGQLFLFYERLAGGQMGLNNCFDLLFSADRMSEDFSMDSYAVSDFLSYEAPGKFDLVTMISGMDYFYIDEFFEKASSMIKDGGVFATANEYTYEMFACAMHLAMDGPWLHSRLSREDLFRYYEEFQPELKDIVKQGVYFPEIHVTIKYYKESAKKYGLELVTYRRTINKPHVQAILFSDHFLKNYFINVVLPDAQAINPNVVPDDFFTSWMNMVYRKSG